jgi:hypothetical protein
MKPSNSDMVYYLLPLNTDPIASTTVAVFLFIWYVHLLMWDLIIKISE